MKLYTLFPYTSISGKLLRLPLKLIPKDAKLPIIYGKIKGNKWIVSSTLTGCWLGIYEYEKQVLLSKVVKRGDVFFDVGAHVGFHTLLASKLVGSHGRVFAFEPLPRNLEYLREHLRINSYKNVEVIETAIGNDVGFTYFDKGEYPWGAHISSLGEYSVKLFTLDELVIKRGLPYPNHMKIDVEGAELSVLQGAKKILLEKGPNIFLDAHGEKLFNECYKFLSSLGYNIIIKWGENFAYK